MNRGQAGERLICCDAAVLASGGFQANTEWRARYLGSGWDLAKVRGTSYNTGDGIRMALEAGASPAAFLAGGVRPDPDRARGAAVGQPVPLGGEPQVLGQLVPARGRAQPPTERWPGSPVTLCGPA